MSQTGGGERSWTEHILCHGGDGISRGKDLQQSNRENFFVPHTYTTSMLLSTETHGKQGDKGMKAI